MKSLTSFGFLPMSATYLLSAVTTGSVSITFSNTLNVPETAGDSIRVSNTGAGWIFVVAGKGAQTATVGSGTPVAPGTSAVIRVQPGVNGADTVAAIVNTGGAATAVYVQRGQGGS